MENAYTVGIVGAGPIGLELAVALKRAGVRYIQWEAGQIGSTMQWWPPGTRWFSSPERIAIAGVPLVTQAQEKATREEYLAYLRGVVGQFGLGVHTYERVSSVQCPVSSTGDGGPGDFVVRTRTLAGEERNYAVRRLVLCTGGTAKPRLLGVPGEDLPHVSHYLADPHAYFGQRILVVGGRNSAVEAALRCYRVGARVALSYRRPALDAQDIKYWLYPEIRSLLKTGRIAGHFSTHIRAITPQAVVLEDATGHAEEVAANFVLLMTGYMADMSLFEMLGVELEEGRQVPLINEQTMETSVPGVYVAGTAVAGTQEKYHVFLENCHVHVERIVEALTGQAAAGVALETPEDVVVRPES